MEIKASLTLQDILERGDRNLKVASGQDAQKRPPAPPPRGSTVAAASPTAYGEGSIYGPQAQRSARDERPFQGNDEQGERAQERAGDLGGTDDNFKRLGEKPEGQPKPVWPVMAQAAYHGLAGEVVRTIEPHSEADPNGMLIQFLAAFGNAIGEEPYYQVEGDKHRAKIFVVTSGVTAKGRKGTALGRMRQVMSIAAPEWERNNIQSGLSSGEGVIFHVRDPVTRLNNDGTTEEVDEGVADKRLMLVTEEFVSALSVMERAGNTLSPVLRDAWGTTKLQTLTRHSPLKATHSHISIIGHVTDDELRSALTRTEMANGFANRFLFMRVRRSKQLPHGGDLDPAVLQELGEKVGIAVKRAQTLGRIRMAPETASAWERIYGDLSSERPGLLGAIIGRAEAQVIRLALIYAVLDNQPLIGLAHLEAAMAVWSYCEESTAQIFGDLLGDSVADTILSALRTAGSAGMSRTGISGLFFRHVPSARISIALNLLQRLAVAKPSLTLSGRHKLETWHFEGGK